MARRCEATLSGGTVFLGRQQLLAPCSVFALPWPTTFLMASTDYCYLPAEAVWPSSYIDYNFWWVRCLDNLFKNKRNFQDLFHNGRFQPTAFPRAVPNVRTRATESSTIRNSPNKRRQIGRFQLKDYVEADDVVLKMENPSKKSKLTWPSNSNH